MKRFYLAVFLALLIFVASCHKDNTVTVPTLSKPADAFSSDAIRSNFSLMCKLAKSTKGFFPTQTARAYGYVGIAAYESVMHGIPGAKSLVGQVNGLTAIPQPNPTLSYNWAISSNAATSDMMRKMFDLNLTAANSASIDSLEALNLSALSGGVNADVISRSVQYGKDVSAAVYAASVTDGGHQSYVDPFQLPYTVPAGDYCWVPTSAALSPVSPKWGTNRPFITDDVSSVVPTPPVGFSAEAGSAFYNQAMVVYNQVKNNTADQVAITRFWADDPFNTCTPAGHTFNIMIQLLKENGATLAKASVGFAKLSIAENDAFISCWKGKYQYNLIRPVSYIKKYIDPAFTTVIGTPAFPAYTGGHSYESGAGSMIFINMFTDGSGKYNFTDYSQLQYGFAARSYTNFNDMALECANSRLYAGIHYDADNKEGLRLGRMVGDNVNKMIDWPNNLK